MDSDSHLTTAIFVLGAITFIQSLASIIIPFFKTDAETEEKKQEPTKLRKEMDDIQVAFEAAQEKMEQLNGFLGTTSLEGTTLKGLLKSYNFLTPKTLDATLKSLVEKSDSQLIQGLNKIYQTIKTKTNPK